jgi:hypothetical protein
MEIWAPTLWIPSRIWRMENGEWRMENGEWRMENVVINDEFSQSMALA